MKTLLKGMLIAGLAIAVSIARLHGGTVALDNRAEGGLSATLRLPEGPPAGA